MNRYGNPNATRGYLAGNGIATHVLWSRDNLRVNKDKSGKRKFFCIRVFSSIKLRLTVMSTNFEYRERERQRIRESRRQTGEAQREKERQRTRARDKKQRRHFLLEEQHENFVVPVRKWEMLAATKVKISGSEKKWTTTRTTFVVVVQNNGKIMYKKLCCTCKVVVLC